MSNNITFSNFFQQPEEANIPLLHKQTYGLESSLCGIKNGFRTGNLHSQIFASPPFSAAPRAAFLTPNISNRTGPSGHPGYTLPTGQTRPTWAKTTKHSEAPSHQEYLESLSRTMAWKALSIETPQIPHSSPSLEPCGVGASRASPWAASLAIWFATGRFTPPGAGSIFMFNSAKRLKVNDRSTGRQDRTLPHQCPQLGYGTREHEDARVYGTP